MSVLAVVTDRDDSLAFLSWAMAIADSKQQPLVVLCWSYATTVKYPLLASEDEMVDSNALATKTRQQLSKVAQSDGAGHDIDTETIEIHQAVDPDPINAILSEIRARNHDCVILSSDALPPIGRGADDPVTHPLFRRSPCETIILSRVTKLPPNSRHVLVLAADSPHDQAALETLSDMAHRGQLKLTLARLEDEADAEAFELGRREIKRLMRDAGVKSNSGIKRRVFSRNAAEDLVTLAQTKDLVLLGADQKTLFRSLCERTTRPAIALIKRAPPLKRFGRIGSSRWTTKLSPADYAEMMQGLRRGAELKADFLVMLGLAAAIASLGLLQDSPAVVIGSMLLAPLMTPMIACGLAIAQGNKRLGRRSMISIGVGFLLTLAVSFVVSVVSPGNEITQEITARGSPNILDLLIALLSAAAAAYALARPSIIGAIAGVAIATALVPPLCSAGISLSYGEYHNGIGAAALFATNLVAIVLGAAITFRLLGVTTTVADREQRRWVYRILTAIGLILILLAYPLQLKLNQRIDEGQAQPRNYPLTRATERALAGYLERYRSIDGSPEIELVASGRPSTLYDRADVVLVLSSPVPLSRSLSSELVDICKKQMDNPELVVEVHCFLDAWKHEPPNTEEPEPESD